MKGETKTRLTFHMTHKVGKIFNNNVVYMLIFIFRHVPWKYLEFGLITQAQSLIFIAAFWARISDTYDVCVGSMINWSWMNLVWYRIRWNFFSVGMIFQHLRVTKNKRQYFASNPSFHLPFFFFLRIPLSTERKSGEQPGTIRSVPLGTIPLILPVAHSSFA